MGTDRYGIVVTTRAAANRAARRGLSPARLERLRACAVTSRAADGRRWSRSLATSGARRIRRARAGLRDGAGSRDGRLHILSSPRGLSPTGVGPAVMVGQLALLGAALVANRVWPEATRVLAEPSLALGAAGALAIALGVALWALTLRRFLHDFPRGELITRGPYRFCRHPLYASLVLLVVPGIGLVTQTWTILVAALAGAAWTSVLVPREEQAMEQEFGAAWRDYRARTRRLIPLPPLGRARVRTPPPAPR